MPRLISDIEIITYHSDNPARLLENGIKFAREQSLYLFGIDDAGHSDKIKEWERSNCSVIVQFIRMRSAGGYMGWQYIVEFETWCEWYDDE